MKRSPLKRKKPLIRKTRWRPKRSSAYKSRARDTPYMMWIKRQPCAARVFAHLRPCSGRVDPDHAGRRPYGRKAPDRTCIPMCRQHHRERDTFAGAFRDWDHDRMRNWLDFQINWHQAEYDLQQEREVNHGR